MGPVYMTATHIDARYHVKVVLMGSVSVGKTALWNRFFAGQFDSTSASTIGCDSRRLALKIDGEMVSFNILDTAGQERFRTAVTSLYYRDAIGVFLVFDASVRQTFDDIAEWLNRLKSWQQEQQMKDVPSTIALVANKVDLVEERRVDKDTAALFALAHGMRYYETSAKTGEGIEIALHETLMQTFEKGRVWLDQQRDSKEKMERIRLFPEEKEEIRKPAKKGGCC
jgi:small GTP-binding protein